MKGTLFSNNSGSIKERIQTSTEMGSDQSAPGRCLGDLEVGHYTGTQLCRPTQLLSPIREKNRPDRGSVFAMDVAFHNCKLAAVFKDHTCILNLGLDL